MKINKKRCFILLVLILLLIFQNEIFNLIDTTMQTDNPEILWTVTKTIPDWYPNNQDYASTDAEADEWEDRLNGMSLSRAALMDDYDTFKMTMDYQEISPDQAQPLINCYFESVVLPDVLKDEIISASNEFIDYYKETINPDDPLCTYENLPSDEEAAINSDECSPNNEVFHYNMDSSLFFIIGEMEGFPILRVLYLIYFLNKKFNYDISLYLKIQSLYRKFLSLRAKIGKEFFIRAQLTKIFPLFLLFVFFSFLILIKFNIYCIIYNNAEGIALNTSFEASCSCFLCFRRMDDFRAIYLGDLSAGRSLLEATANRNTYHLDAVIQDENITTRSEAMRLLNMGLNDSSFPISIRYRVFDRFTDMLDELGHFSTIAFSLELEGLSSIRLTFSLVKIILYFKNFFLSNHLPNILLRKIGNFPPLVILKNFYQHIINMAINQLVLKTIIKFLISLGVAASQVIILKYYLTIDTN